jgi:iron complex outermembrane recepter protein
MKLKHLTAALLATCVTMPAFAQQTGAGDAGAKEETIVITGSLIRRLPQESALPIQVFTADDLQREGIVNPEQFIAQLTSNGSGLDNLASNADVVGGAQRGNNGASSANLRGQGAAATLILLNGRRVAAHGLNGGIVDVNQIPLAAIERIEVLKDGASAIYGTDAVGGVINYITRKNFRGVQASAFTDITEQGGGNIYRGSLLVGAGDLGQHGVNIMAAVSYTENRELRGSQRDFVNTFQPNKGLSVDTRGTPFATIFPLAGSAIPSAGAAPLVPGSTTVRASGGINVLDLPGNLGCGAIDGMQPYDDRLWDLPTAQFACAWDTGRAAVLQQPINTLSFLTRGQAVFGEHTVTAEFVWSNADSSKRFSNPQISSNTTTQNFAYPRNTLTQATYDRVFDQLVAAFPSLSTQRGQPLAIRWRCIECGRRELTTRTETGRMFVGAEGPLFGLGDWEYRVGGSYAYSDASSRLGDGYFYRNTTRDAAGNVIATGLIDVLNTGVINLFLLPGQTQTPEALAALRSTSAKGVTLYGGKFGITQFDAAVTGSLFPIWGGDVKAAIGVDYRREKYTFNGDQRAAAARPVILLAPFDDGNALPGAKRDIKAVFAEVLFPILEDLEVTGAIRYDDYTGFGGTTNPKVSLKYRPIRQIMLRGSYNTSFRVPAFNQIFNGQSLAPYSGRDIVDPLSCPTGRVDSTRPGCDAIQPQILNGGRLDLAPETANQFSVGVVIEPTPNYSLSVDWWRIQREGTLQILSLQQLVDNFALFPERFVRATSNGPVQIIDQTWINAGETITSGIEVSARGQGELFNGTWSASLDGTYLLEKKSRLTARAPFSASEVGRFTFAGDLGIRWKHNLTLGYAQEKWSASITQIFRLGYTNFQLPGVASGLINPPDDITKTDNYVIYNISGTYRFTDQLSLTAGVKNLFNTDPPFAINYDSNFGSGSSWEPRVADPRGRAFTVQLSYKL